MVILFALFLILTLINLSIGVIKYGDLLSWNTTNIVEILAVEILIVTLIIISLIP